MKLFLIVLLFSSFRVDAKTSLEELKKKIAKLDLTKIGAIDLCTDRKVQLPKLQSLKVWSINCANCLWEFEDQGSKLDRRHTLINVDTKELDRKKACLWIKEHNLKVTSINDNGSIKDLLGESYPLPMSLRVKENSPIDIQFGYWRKK